jgi:CBS domain containing-hemolysin-like protein
MLAALVLLALAAALVVSAAVLEAALFALPYSQVMELASAKRRGARALARLRAEPAALLATLWTLRVAGAALAATVVWLALDFLPVSGTLRGVVTIVLVGSAAVLAELAGKSLGQHGAEQLCLQAAIPVRLLSVLLAPITWPAGLIAGLLAPEATEFAAGVSERELRELAGPGHDRAIEEHERRLIERALQLDQITAYDIMTPRVGMVAWPETRTLAEVAAELRTVPYSRIPLYRGSVDKITGILDTRDAFQALISGQRDVELRALAREPFFVPGSVTLDKLLHDFQARRIHTGIVIDEYGGVDGLLALEDILEELVGEIAEERGAADDSIVRLSRNEILVDGSADLREINHFFNTNFPLLEHRSLNGYLLDVLGRVPELGEQVSREGVRIEVTAVSETQVLRARLIRLAPSASGQASDALEPGTTAEPRKAAEPAPSPRGRGASQARSFPDRDKGR